MDAIVEVLRDYPAEYGYSQKDLCELVFDANWSDPQAASRLRRQLRQRAGDALRSWEYLPSKFECSKDVALRNLIASARKDDLSVYRILLRYESIASESSIPEQLEDVLKVLPRSDAELSLIETLILSEREPEPGEYADILSEDPEKSFLARFWAALGEKSISEDAIAETFAVVAADLSDDDTVICIEAFQKLHQKKKWPPFVSRVFAKTLARPIRRTLLRSERLLTSDLREQLEADPYCHPDAPAVLARAGMIENALLHVANKNLAHRAVVELAEDIESFQRNLKAIRKAIAKERKYQGPGTQGSLQLRTALQGYSDCPEALALTLLSHGLTQRHVILTAAPKRLAVAAINLLDLGTLTQLLTETRTIKGRAGVLSLIGDTQVLYKLLKRCYLSESVPRPTKHQDLLAEWFRVGTLRELANTVRLDNSVILSFAKVGRKEIKFLELLQVVSSTLSGNVIYQLLTPRLRKAYRESDPAKAEAIIDQLASQLTKPRRIGEWLNCERFRSVARWLPETAVAVLLKRQEVWAFVTITETPAIWRLDAEILVRLMSLKYSKMEPLWLRALKYRTTEKPLAAGFRRYVAAHPKDLAQAFDVAPLLFWRHVRSKYSVQQLLPAALRSPRLAFELEKRVSRKKLRAELHWVREKWHDKPTIAAAYEVATALSLPDAALIVKLALRLTGPVAAERQGTAFDGLYRTYELPKQAGGTRTITVPNRLLKRLQRRLLHNGFDEIELHAAAMGFRKGRSIRDNAERHVNKRLVVNVDIRKFFPSTGYRLILRAARKLLNGEISPRAARLVAELCSYNNALPTGAPTSPAIANIVLLSADQAISTVAERSGISYTRYADDLTFSGDDGVLGILPFVRDVLEQLGYQLDARKTNLYRRGRRQLVTGLVVNAKPNMPRRQRRELRAAVHHRLSGKQPHWHGRPISDHVLLGHLAYLHLTQPEEASAYRRQLFEVIDK